MTLYVTLLVLPSTVDTTAVVFTPFTKFTVSYGFTKSTAEPLPCKFQPAFNTSPTVAAFAGFTWLADVPNDGAACDLVALLGFVAVFGASLFFVSGRLDFTFVILTGFVPSLSDTLMLPSSVLDNFGP